MSGSELRAQYDICHEAFHLQAQFYPNVSNYEESPTDQLSIKVSCAEAVLMTSTSLGDVVTVFTSAL